MPAMADPNVVLLAAEEGGGTSNFLIPNGTFFFVLIIFLIVLGVIGKWVVPPVSKVLRERDAMVKQTVEDSPQGSRPVLRRRRGLPVRDGQGARRQPRNFVTRRERKGERSWRTCEAGPPTKCRRPCSRPTEQLKQQADAIESDLRSSVDTLSVTLASRVLGVEINAATSASGR